jgi:hypothetical protein
MGLNTSWRRSGAALLTSMLLMFGALVPVAVQAASTALNCDSNAMMWCGATSKSEFDNKLHNGDGHNSAANLQQIYIGEGRLTQASFDASTTVMGTVFKDGRVVVGGKVVATDARSDGRVQEAGSVKVGTMWRSTTQTSFLSDSIPAFVNMQGGTMRWFVLQSCGNFGVGKPVASPPPSKTTTPPPVPQKKVSVSCVAIAVAQVDKTNPSKMRFTVTPSGQATGSRFNFNGNDPQDSDSMSVDKDMQPNTTTKVDGQVKSADGVTPINNVCSATIIINQQKVVKIVKTVATTVVTTTMQPQVLSAETQPAPLPATGPEAMLGGAAGLVGLGYASRAYLRSKKSLLGALRKPRGDR